MVSCGSMKKSDTNPGPLPEILLATHNWTVGHWIDNENYDLDAPYQRGSVWTDEQRRDLIKSLHMGLPVGAVTVSKLPWRNYLPNTQKGYRVVDGKQRIETVRAFANDEFSVPAFWFRSGALSDAAVAVDRKAVTWSNLSIASQRRFDMNMSLPAHEFQAETEYLCQSDGTGKWM